MPMMAELSQDAQTAIVRDAQSQIAQLSGDYALAVEHGHDKDAEEARSKILACAEIIGTEAKTFSAHALDCLRELREHVAKHVAEIDQGEPVGEAAGEREVFLLHVLNRVVGQPATA
jgi:hypothetical protein